jgi:molybdopterin synthase catalytic subunit
LRIRVRPFALYRERLGRDELVLEVEEGTSLARLIEALRGRYPELALPSSPIVAAVNAEYAEPGYVLKEGDEVALIPPVSGGSPFVEIKEEPLSPQEVTARVRKDTCGAVVTFLGTARLYSHGRRVLYLEYEAYREMALRKLREVAEEAITRWGVEDVAIAHRTGRVAVGEICLVIAVASPHRREAFQACQYAIDRIKEVVPIWKKEVFENGHIWVGAEEASRNSTL